MARIEFATDRNRWLRRAAVTQAAACAAVLCVAVTVTPAFAGVGIGIAPTYPALLEVGQTNVAVSLTITNTSNATEASGTLTLTKILHTPSCGIDTAPCPSGKEDKGVFLVHGPVSGHTGTACASKTFTIGSPDATTGEVEFVPSGGNVVLQPPGTAGDACTIDFFVDMLRLPVIDASPNPGLQTAQLARMTGRSDVTSVSGTPTGAGLVTGTASTPQLPAPALSPTILGLVALLLGAYGAARSRRKAATLRSVAGRF